MVTPDTDVLSTSLLLPPFWNYFIIVFYKWKRIYTHPRKVFFSNIMNRNKDAINKSLHEFAKLRNSAVVNDSRYENATSWLTDWRRSTLVKVATMPMTANNLSSKIVLRATNDVLWQ